jgi:hypothetical protein
LKKSLKIDFFFFKKKKKIFLKILIKKIFFKCP